VSSVKLLSVFQRVCINKISDVRGCCNDADVTF
jgi:hypothetical protein